ncbi:MAG: hypothetical protein U0793_14360 [Gemmataceae bacterium]
MPTTGTLITAVFNNGGVTASQLNWIDSVQQTLAAFRQPEHRQRHQRR